MLCRISGLDSQGEIITQTLLTKEFNAEEDDVAKHINELIKSFIITERLPKSRKKLPRSKRSKSPRAVIKQTKALQSVGLISKRFATKKDKENNPDIGIKEAIYEFTDKIKGYFTIYANILNDMLDWTTLINIPQIRRYISTKKPKKEAN